MFSKILLGSNIRYERKRMNLSINQLAERVGLSPSFLGLVERGERGLSLDAAVSLARTFNMPVDRLLLSNLAKENRNGGKFNESDSEFDITDGPWENFNKEDDLFTYTEEELMRIREESKRFAEESARNFN